MNIPILNILNSGKMALRMIFIMCSLLMLSQQDAKATHIVGGNLTYRCLGNNQYEIRLSLRRDCLLGAPDAQFDDPASIGFFDATTNLPLAFVGFGGEFLMDFNEDDTLNQILVSDCSIAGNPVCVHQTTYVDTIFLPFWANGYKMVYQRCCRNGSVQNILNPLLTGMTLVSEMSGEAQQVCKSSPQIGSYPPIYICVNKDIDYFLPATDLQGDSLSFSLATPFSGGDIINNMPQPPNPPPYDLVNWRPPYSLANVMGGIPLNIDPVTGHITGRPNTIGQFVITIVITSYRNGRELTQTRVDFQYNVRACRDVPVADFTSPGLNCDGLSMNFTNLSVDADEYLWIFDYGNPESDTSIEVNPIYTYEQEGFYDVALIVNDSDKICYDTIIQTIGVFFSGLNAEFSYSSNSCTDGIVLDVTDLSTGAYPIVAWEWLLTYPGGVLASTDQNPTFSFDIEEPSTVFLVLIVTDTNGCTASEAKSFQVQELDLIFNPEADSICFGESVHLLLGGDSTLTYTWEPPNGLNLNQPWDPIAFPGISVEYFVTVTDGVCTITDSVFVEVQQLPDLAFDYETDCKSLEVQFSNTSTNGVNYHWDFGDTSITSDTSTLVNPTYTYNQPGVYIVTLSSRDGCDVSITDTITANTILDQLPEAIVNCFKDSIELNPGFNPNYNYVWSPAEFLNNPNLPNPTAGVDNDTWFYVTITENSLPGCQIVDSILLQVPDDFDIDAGEETITSCDFNDISLSATVTGNTNVTITWKDVDGNILGNGNVLVVNPENSTTYYVMAMDTLGCMKTDSIRVLKPDPTFEVNIIPNDTVYCYIQTITLMATSVAGVTFEWYNANNELIGTGTTIDVTPGVFSCYHLIGTDPLGCQASDTVCLSPTYFEVNISSAGEDFCLGENTTLTASTSSVNGVTYEWFNTLGESVGTGESLTVSPQFTTCYYLVGTDTLGCQDADTICINPIPFDASITGDNAVCPGDPTTLTVTSNSGGPLTYIWDPTGSTDPFIVAVPEVTTTYSVTVTNTEFGCDTILSVTVEVFQFEPAIVIDAEPDTVDLTKPTQLTVNQNPDFDYVWEAIPPGDNIPPIYNPLVTPLETTTYCVTVTDDNGCTGTACIVVTVNDLFCDDRDIFIPNAFTPNGSGVNDMLFVRSNFIATMELVIYNRWGEKVFSTTDQSIGWDGTYKGQLLSPDVFGYYLTVMCPNEETYTKKGNITLLH